MARCKTCGNRHACRVNLRRQRKAKARELVRRQRQAAERAEYRKEMAAERRVAVTKAIVFQMEANGAEEIEIATAVARRQRCSIGSAGLQVRAIQTVLWASIRRSADETFLPCGSSHHRAHQLDAISGPDWCIRCGEQFVWHFVDRRPVTCESWARCGVRVGRAPFPWQNTTGVDLPMWDAGGYVNCRECLRMLRVESRLEGRRGMTLEAKAT